MTADAFEEWAVARKLAAQQRDKRTAERDLHRLADDGCPNHERNGE